MTLLNNGYPGRFILKHIQEVSKGTLILMARRKELHTELSFKGDRKCEPLVRRPRNAITHTFPTATLRERFTTRSVVSTNFKDKLSVLSSSALTYSFVCSCFGKLFRKNDKAAVTRNQEAQADQDEYGNQKVYNYCDRSPPLGQRTLGG